MEIMAEDIVDMVSRGAAITVKEGPSERTYEIREYDGEFTVENVDTGRTHTAPLSWMENMISHLGA